MTLESLAGYGAVLLVTATTLAACVLLQYEYLIFVWRRLSSRRAHRRVNVLYGIGSVLLLHIVEVWIFAAALWLLLRFPAAGALSGEVTAEAFIDYVYFSLICFTTVGFGEMWPTGPVRFFAGTEALAGFVLITWSASFTYLEMERFWRADELKQRRE